MAVLMASHSSRVSHARAADGLDESFFDDTVLDVERQLASTLLGSAPANAMCQAADVLNLFCLYPLALFRNGSRTMVGAFGHTTHVLNFV